MIKTKYFSSSFSSISVSFASVFLFSTLFAACCFTFLYLQPQQDHDASDDRHVHDIKLFRSPPSDNRKPNIDAPILRVQDLTNPRSLDDDQDQDQDQNQVQDQDDAAGGGFIKELVGNSTTMAEDGNQEGITDQKKVVNATASGDSVIPKTTAEDGGDINQGNSDQKVENSGGTEAEATTTTVDGGDRGVVSNSTAGDPPAVKVEEEELESGTEDVFKPPFNASVEQRIEWFKASISKMKVFDSTKKTRAFDNRIQDFLRSGGGCKGRFFTTWVSPSRLFGEREILALETIFKAHPKGCAVIVSKSMDSKRGRALLKPLVDQGYKVLAVTPDLSLLLTGTPAEPWLAGLKSGALDPGTVPITQTLSHLLRHVLLYKYGGVYLDTDVIVLKDLLGLRNSIGVQAVEDPGRIWSSLNGAVMMFDRKHPLLLKLIEEVVANFNTRNGPDMVSRVVMKVAFNDSAYAFNIMSPSAFYPVDWIHVARYFREPKTANETQWTYDEDFVLEQRSYTVHLWSHVTSKLRIEPHSLIGRVISDHCIICKDIYDSDFSSSTSTSS